MRFFCFLFGNSRTARHLLVRALPNSSIRIHCIPSVAWDTPVEVEFLVEVKFFITSVDHKGVTCYGLRGRGVESVH